MGIFDPIKKIFGGKEEILMVVDPPQKTLEEQQKEHTEALFGDLAKSYKTRSNLEYLDHRKGFTIDPNEQNSDGIYVEQTDNVSNELLRRMARKNSVIIATHQSLINQLSNFSQEQRDKYSPGYRFRAKDPADLTAEEKMQLANPELSDDEFLKLKYALDKKKSERQKKQKEEIQKCLDFIKFCGSDKLDTDTTHKRVDFDKFLKLTARDRLTYNYAAVELVPTKGGDKISHFYAISAGSIRYVSLTSQKDYANIIKPAIKDFMGESYKEPKKGELFRYVQVLNRKIEAAFTESELIFEPANPSVDLYDKYAPGELSWLINTITSHLYTEGHNRNFFTNGLGTKGILHIKGDKISKSQLEGFSRLWNNSVTNTKNAFRPPVLGMADDVKWVPLTQSNRDMEFQYWIEYLIKIITGTYQIDPAEINFDISKGTASTLSEGNSSERWKGSKTKGLRPLLMYFQNIINHQIMPRWNKDLAEKYVFEFVGLDAESKKEEVERYKEEVQVYKTVNEIRTEQGLPPIENGDIILSAAYTQFLQMKLQADAEAGGEMGEEGGGDVEGEEEMDFSDLDQEADEILAELDLHEMEGDAEDAVSAADEKAKAKDVKKSTITYNWIDEDEEG